jgi:aerobic carbon-monoxide dehydrogenase small subunit
MMRIALQVNGKPVEAEVAPRTNLADFLREQLLLTGTHVGCEHGICGACTVEINGEIARSCITYAVACEGARVRTIEGFDDDALMERLRSAFKTEHALQCGYCTPGMLIAARDLVRRKPRLTRAQIRTEMSGNLCRCTGYMGIVSAIERAMAEPEPPPVVPGSEGWLGPAPGPTAPSAPAQPMQPVATAAATPVAQQATDSRPIGTPSSRVRVTVGEFEERDGATVLAQSFVLPHPRDAVWKLMSDVEALARCMPGLSLDAPPRDGQLAGRLHVKIGPITAVFAGTGTLRSFPLEYRQQIEGRGGDRRSGSAVTGAVDYRLSAEHDGEQPATRVDATTRYSLSGPLAQFGRSAIARDLARRIGEAFAHNVDAQLRSPGASISAKPLGGLTLLARAIAEHLRRVLGRLLTRNGHR